METPNFRTPADTRLPCEKPRKNHWSPSIASLAPLAKRSVQFGNLKCPRDVYINAKTVNYMFKDV